MRSLPDISVQFIKGVGPARKLKFGQLGVDSVEDLFYLFPRRYEDRRKMVPIAKLKIGEWQTIAGKVLLQGGRKSWYTKKHVSEVVVEDESGRIVCTWFNRPYLDKYFKPGLSVVCYGKVDVYKNRLQMVSPEYELIEDEDEQNLSTGRIVPIYPLTRGITQRYLRRTIRTCLDKYKEELTDELPVGLRNKHRFMNIKRSLENIHFPASMEEQEAAIKRISFEEFFFFQVSIILRRMSVVQKTGTAHKISDTEVIRFTQSFPFELTAAQKRVIREIRGDMERPSPMLRLLQGDVGSGKTVVALFGCYAAFLNGAQSALMAPTEILARQHYESITRFIRSGPLKDLNVALLTSSVKKEDKEKIHEHVRSGKIHLVIGTHALITDEVAFKNLTYVVIDEQHKFGVRQRALLTEKGKNPDVLIMTATPIPRTLCITLYGDLDLSVLDELPPGRGKIKTVLYRNDRAQEVYELIRKKVTEGRQVYIVYPIIEESEKVDLKAAEKMYKEFKKEHFKDFSVGLVHGQMDPKDAQKVMRQFQDRAIDILVATTVLEVGVDVPNAGVMVIEHADRFGLSQLHQLRGRIGRGKEDALCVLMSGEEDPESHERLKAILSTGDGFKVAEADLAIRGPGRFFGRHQHGLNELKVANPLTQLDILELARTEAEAVLKDDAKLDKGMNPRIKQLITKRYPTYLSMVTAG